MLSSPPREKKWVSWLFVFIWVAVIFITLYNARALANFVSQNYHRIYFRNFVLATVGIGGLFSAIYFWRTRARLHFSQCIWLAAVLGIFTWWTFQLRASPEEAMHFVQYGILGLLLFRAMTHHLRDPLVYVAALLIGGMIGTYDEVVQWVVPSRYWDFRDIWLNFAAVGLVQIAVWKGLRPPYIEGRPGAASIRLVLRLLIGAAVLLFCCLLNTPARILILTEQFPSLSFLRPNPSVMAEYGYFYKDPEIGSFRSRLTLQQLAKIDREQAEEKAFELDKYVRPMHYQMFIRVYPSSRDPFLHEMRVHVARRDRWRRKSYEVKQEDPEEYRRRLTIAYRENQILEKYYGNSLKHSSAQYPPDLVEGIRKKHLPEIDYESPVSGELITGYKEWQLLSALGILILGLVISERRVGLFLKKMQNARESVE